MKSRGQDPLPPDNSEANRIILLTSLTDVPRLRWLKHLLGCRYLLSEKSEGFTNRIYCALMASVLLAQITGTNVVRRAFNLVCLYLLV